MLELRPTCENCSTALAPNDTEAMICSFESTFCRTCVDKVLRGVCSNCGGNFVPRPIRPAKNWRGHNCLLQFPATARKESRPVDPEAHRAFAEHLRPIPPEKR